MTAVAILVLVVTAIVVAGHVRAVRAHARRIAAASPLPEPAVRWPPAAVILCVRGADRGLGECLDRLAAVDYPEIEVHVVVDHATDPSHAVAEAWRARHPAVACRVHVLDDRSPHATLKCSAVDQALGRLSHRVEVAVIVDADARVYPRWLQDMVLPTLDTAVGMATGNRWYDPTAPGIGSLVRFVYNANCVVPMHLGGMTWGGSLSLRRDVFDHPAFRPTLRRSPTEDATVRLAVATQAGQLRCLPAVMLLTSDGIRLAPCLGFIRRQLLWTRLYHPAWPLVIAGAVSAYAVAAGAVIAAVWATWCGHFLMAGLFAATPLLATVGNLVSIEGLHGAVRRCIEERQGTSVPPIDWPTRWRLLGAIPLTLPAFAWAAVSAACARRVTWSGVRYAVLGHGRIALIDYRPAMETRSPGSPELGRGQAGRGWPHVRCP